MRVYVAGPLFSEAERAWLDALAARLRMNGFDCFVPHEKFPELTDALLEAPLAGSGHPLRSATAPGGSPCPRTSTRSGWS